MLYKPALKCFCQTCFADKWQLAKLAIHACLAYKGIVATTMEDNAMNQDFRYRVNRVIGLIRAAMARGAVGRAWRAQAMRAKRMAAEAVAPHTYGGAAAYLYSAAAEAFFAARGAAELAETYEPALPTRAFELRDAAAALYEASAALEALADEIREHAREVA